MEVPPVPTLLFKSNYYSVPSNINGNVMYFEVPVNGSEVNLQVRYRNSGMFFNATEDIFSAKPGLRRFWFYCGLGDYDVFSQITIGQNISQSAFNYVTGYATSAPRCLNARVITSTDTQIDLELTGSFIFNVLPAMAVTVLMKVVGAPAYNITTPVARLANGRGFTCSVVGLTPNTPYQYIVTSNNLISISVTDPFLTTTQLVGCPVGLPLFGPSPYVATTNENVSITVYSSFANVTGNNLVCTGIITLPNGQRQSSIVNVQNNTTLTSIHTFNGLDPNTEYSLNTIVTNANGFQVSNGDRILTPVLPFNPATPFPGYIGIIPFTSLLIVSEIASGAFLGNLTIEVSPDIAFTPATIENYPYVRTANPSIITSTQDLPAGQIKYARCRLYDASRNSIRYSNTYIWDEGIKKIL